MILGEYLPPNPLGADGKKNSKLAKFSLLKPLKNQLCIYPPKTNFERF